MKLSEFRQIIFNYDSTYYPRKFIYGDHPEVVKLKEFAKKYEQMPNDYEFTVSDRFELLELIQVDSDLQIIKSMKWPFNFDGSLQLFSFLTKLGLMTLPVFEMIERVRSRYELQSFLCSGQLDISIITPEVLNVVLEVLSRRKYDIESLKECLNILGRHHKLTPAALDLVQKSNAEQSRQLVKTFQELERAKSLNDAYLKFLTEQESLDPFAEFIALLNRLNIKLTDELNGFIFSNNFISHINEILLILIDSDCHINQELVITLLKKNNDYFQNKTVILKLLQSYGMLDDNAFACVSNGKYDLFIKQILTILSDHSLLFRNKILIDKILNEEISAYWLSEAINYLKSANLLTQETLVLCANKLELKLNKEVAGVFRLLALLKCNEIYVGKNQLVTLLTWSELNIDRLLSIVNKLKYHESLNPASFQEAFKRVSLKMPSAQESSVQKLSQNKSHSSRTEVILDGQLRYFKAPGKEVEKDAYGAVKKGFNSQDASEPVFAIKKLSEPDKDTAIKAAIREVKYNRVLGRQAYFFVNESVTVVSEWQHEKALNQFTRDELLHTLIIKRLKCLRSGLLELNHLHGNFRIHGNVKSENFILDLKNLTSKLIGLNTAHKKSSLKLFEQALAYRDPQQHYDKDHYSNDIYAMGIVVMQLFPEIYDVTFDNNDVTFRISMPNHSYEEEAIMVLVNMMMHHNSNVRCTSEDALAYCDELIKYHGRLNCETIVGIADDVFNRTKPTIEDVLRESKQSSCY